MVLEPRSNPKVLLGPAPRGFQQTQFVGGKPAQVGTTQVCLCFCFSLPQLVILNHFYRALYNTPPLLGSKSTSETLLNSNPVIRLRITHTGLVPTRQLVKVSGLLVSLVCSFLAGECQENALKVRSVASVVSYLTYLVLGMQSIFFYL